jgi:hypothetical protein
MKHINLNNSLLIDTHGSGCNVVIDKGTSKEEAHRYEAELAELEEKLFAESARAAVYGAKIVFWSEANAMLYPENLEAFIVRAQAFAREHQVYFAPAFAVFRYGEATSMAVDYQGRLLAHQDFFTTDDPVMIVDVPTQGVETGYGMLGDWLVYLSIAFLGVMGAWERLENLK